MRKEDVPSVWKGKLLHTSDCKGTKTGRRNVCVTHGHGHVRRIEHITNVAALKYVGIYLHKRRCTIKWRVKLARYN
jgi:hypothetical protein